MSAKEEEVKIRIAVCGGGNVAHLLAALLGSDSAHRVTIFSRYARELDDFRRGGRTVECVDRGGRPLRAGRIHGLTADPEAAVRRADIVFLAVPMSAHPWMMKRIVPNLRSHCWLVALPATGGWDWMARANGCDDAFGVAPLPYVCRTEIPGRRVCLLGAKKKAYAAALRDSAPADVRRVRKIVGVLGALLRPPGGGLEIEPAPFLSLTCLPTNPILHTARCYGLFGAGAERRYVRPPFPEFYRDCDEVSARWLEELSAENEAIADALRRNWPPGAKEEPPVPAVPCGLGRYLREVARDDDFPGIDGPREAAVRDLLRASRSLRGVGCPLRTERGTEPRAAVDYANRYFTEDGPFGLLAIYGLSRLRGMESADAPCMRRVLLWMQARLPEGRGRDALLDARTGDVLVGTGFAHGAPQQYGIRTLRQLARAE